MKRWLLTYKVQPRATDAAELLASGCKIVDSLFAGLALIVDSDQDLTYTLDPSIWHVEEDSK